MAMDTRTIAALADRLMAAQESCTPIEVPGIEYPGMTVADGYAGQRAIISREARVGNRESEKPGFHYSRLPIPYSLCTSGLTP